MKVAVIGLGKAGLPLASVIAESGIDVIGIDIDSKKCDAINHGINPIPEEVGLDELVRSHGGKRIVATSRYEDARDVRDFIVTVPLFIDKNCNPDYRILESAFRNLGKILKPGDLAILETTVPPGNTDGRIKSWLEEESGLLMGQFYLAHSPERIMTGLSISRLKEFPKIVGGVDEESGRRALELYSKFIPKIHPVTSAKVAEFVKVIEGCYRDVNIALANELYKIAEELDIDFYEARENANHQYCNIHLPSTGVGGHCIPVYPWFLVKEMETRERFEDVRLLRTARELNDEMIRYWTERIILECLQLDKPLKDVRICLKGVTYREGVKGLYHSRNLALARMLVKKGLSAFVCDELFSEDEIESLRLKVIKPEDADVVFNCFNLSIGREGLCATEIRLSELSSQPLMKSC